ncbi:MULTISPECIES: SGNH/GDSL hydrolase family protein [unclassified Streptomyces]|uniref:SGNH/GDSL hydrolase family protein n=1 Tax=unclassified Streptomyces TaxID=2593676 RepID=UPI0004C034DF|nr:MULTISPECIES: SGNH/GDSL hydrolase family protein [unclassified Streptomyces]
MTRRHGCALLAALVAVVVAVSAAVHTRTGRDGGRPTTTVADGPAPHNSAAPASAGTWVGAWSAAPAGGEPGTETTGLAGRSVRNVLHTSVGGTSARVTLSNLYGQQPLTLTHATLAVASTADSAAARPGTMRRLTFAGAPTVVVPPGRQTVSDAVRLTVPRDADLLVTTYSPTASGPVTYHPRARQISYAADGERTEDVAATAYTEQTPYWRYVTALDVMSNESDGTVVVLGDSLTDGLTSTVGADRRWTDVLAERLHTAVSAGRDVPRYSVVNEGISGNRVLTDGLGRPAENPSGLNRFARDALGRTNVKAVVVDLGVNDILHAPEPTTAPEIVAGLRQLVAQAHARGLKVVGATLMPFGGHRGDSAAREAVRQSVNAEVRAGRVYDAYVDFDAALRDPAAPRRLRPAYDSGDHLHPSDAGYRRMAEAFDLGLLKGAARASL